MNAMVAALTPYCGTYSFFLKKDGIVVHMRWHHAPALVMLCHCQVYVTHQIHIIEVRMLQRNIIEEKKGRQTPLIVHIISKAGTRKDSSRTSTQHTTRLSFKPKGGKKIRSLVGSFTRLKAYLYWLCHVK